MVKAEDFGRNFFLVSNPRNSLFYAVSWRTVRRNKENEYKKLLKYSPIWKIIFRLCFEKRLWNGESVWLYLVWYSDHLMVYKITSTRGKENISNGCNHMGRYRRLIPNPLVEVCKWVSLESLSIRSKDININIER